MFCLMVIVGGPASLAAVAATNGFTHSLSQSATSIHSPLRQPTTRSAATDRSHPPRRTVPPTPPTRDRTRTEPYADHSHTRSLLHCIPYL